MTDVEAAALQSHPFYLPSPEVKEKLPQLEQKGDVGILAADQAYRAIKSAILNLQYPPGSLIKDTRLMKTLQLGRTPIREALKKLEVELLVVSRPRQGTYVSEISVSDFAQQHPVHRQLTALAVDLTMQRLTPHRLKKLQYQEQLIPVESTDMVNVILAVLQFHCQIARSSQNFFVEQMLERYCGYIQRIWLLAASRLCSSDLYLQDYGKLIDLMENEDRDRAQTFIGDHLNAVHRQVLRCF